MYKLVLDLGFAYGEICIKSLRVLEHTATSSGQSADMPLH